MEFDLLYQEREREEFDLPYQVWIVVCQRWTLENNWTQCLFGDCSSGKNTSWTERASIQEDNRSLH